MFCLELWALLLFLAHVARADYYVDNTNTSIAFSYAPNTSGAGWKAFGTGIQALAFSIPNGTTTVNVTVDATKCYDQTFALGECGSVENCRLWIPFVGSGITMYVVNAGPEGVSASFSVDNGQPVTQTLQAPLPPDYQQSNVPMFTINSLPTGYHSIVMNVLEWNGQSSWMMFDYALVNETLVANSTNSTATGQSSTTTSSGSSKINVGAIVGGTLAGIAGVAALVFGFLYLRQRRDEVARAEDRAQATPFMAGHPTNDASFVGLGRSFPHRGEDTGSPSPSVRAAILREALSSGSDPGSIPSGMTSTASRPLPSLPSASFNTSHSPTTDMSSPPAAYNTPHGLSPEDMKLLERLRLNNAPAETIARVAESLSGRSNRGASDTSGGGGGLMRAGSLMSAAPPPSYQTGH